MNSSIGLNNLATKDLEQKRAEEVARLVDLAFQFELSGEVNGDAADFPNGFPGAEEQAAFYNRKALSLDPNNFQAYENMRYLYEDSYVIPDKIEFGGMEIPATKGEQLAAIYRKLISLAPKSQGEYQVCLARLIADGKAKALLSDFADQVMPENIYLQAAKLYRNARLKDKQKRVAHALTVPDCKSDSDSEITSPVYDREDISNPGFAELIYKGLVIAEPSDFDDGIMPELPFQQAEKLWFSDLNDEAMIFLARSIKDGHPINKSFIEKYLHKDNWEGWAFFEDEKEKHLCENPSEQAAKICINALTHHHWDQPALELLMELYAENKISVAFNELPLNLKPHEANAFFLSHYLLSTFDSKPAEELINKYSQAPMIRIKKLAEIDKNKLKNKRVNFTDTNKVSELTNAGAIKSLSLFSKKNKPNSQHHSKKAAVKRPAWKP